MYAYCSNNPVMYADPSGNFAISTLIIGAIIGFVVGGATSAVSQGIYCNFRIYNFRKYDRVVNQYGISLFNTSSYIYTGNIFI